MKIFPVRQTRTEYLQTQIDRSDRKFRYCKVSAADALKYRTILQRALAGRRDGARGPILCLGTRNGREVDLFRLQWFGSSLLAAVTRRLERRTHSFTSWVRQLEAIGRSDVRFLSDTSVIGVEVNPRAARRDVWVGSFDDMPSEWSGRFAVVFSNAFDQSQDPERTVREWKRVVRPGGFLIFCFSHDQEPTLTDPVGGLCAADVHSLFGGRLVYFQERGSRNGYSEVILQL